MQGKKARHVSLDMREAAEAGMKGHPQTVILALGIEYQRGTPQSITDTWNFFNCINLPAKLPSYLYANPMKCPTDFIGMGLSEECAEILRDSVIFMNYEQEYYKNEVRAKNNSANDAMSLTDILNKSIPYTELCNQLENNAGE